MARTWHGTSFAFAESKIDERSLHYDVGRKGENILFSVANSGAEALTLPVKSVIGGQRHGMSLLMTIDQLGGNALERPAMIEARYALMPNGSLVLSPGFPKETPQDLEHQLGRVLSPTFQGRCLSCHGGVRCDNCHESAEHLASVTVRPKSLKGAASMEVCAQCHSGFKTRIRTDPMPEDLLVSSQVPALRHTECFIQSGEQLTCTSCHNPHEDSAAVTQTSVNVCFRCHSLSTPQHAAICPVNRTGDCIGCHMPNVQLDSFRLTDHWIRATTAGKAKDPSLRSLFIPKREYLRLIATATDEDMKAATDRLSKGESFGSVARALSKDPSAQAGGFIGAMALADMDPRLATVAASLEQGSDSGVIEMGDRRVVLHREARDFRMTANQLFHEAVNLNERGDRMLAIQKLKQALDVYPYQLRGLNLMGVILKQPSVLGFAVQAYPEDAATLFNFTSVDKSGGQIENLRRVIELDPDLLAAYQSLGTALYAAGRPAEAIETFRAGLKINPLSAVLYYDLGLTLREQGDEKGAADALALAARIDPKINVPQIPPLSGRSP